MMTRPADDLPELSNSSAWSRWRTFASPWEAQLARTRLEAEGIDSVVADEHLARI